MLETVHSFIDKAAKRLGIPPEVVEQLKKNDRELVFDIELDSGKKFKAFRVQHNNKRGPYKGGIRFHKNVNLDEVQSLAALMSLKTAAVGLPLGGGKGGVVVDPRKLNEDELEELSRRYAKHLQPHIGPDKDVPAPDVNTNAKIIDWMVDEYEKITGDDSKASFTGKSIARGGSLGREAATGRGGVVALTELLKLEGKSGGITYAVQGFGNVGSFFGTTAQNDFPDWKLVAASDSEAAVMSDAGLDAGELQKYKAGRGRFKDFKQSGIAIISNEELLQLDVDVLVLAGLEDSVTATNMKSVQADIIVEMANGPISAEADEYLSGSGITILPDVIANAGGVTVSYLEWLQNRQRERWSEEEVNEKLDKYMKTAVKDAYEYAQKHSLNIKEAAFALALERLTSD